MNLNRYRIDPLTITSPYEPGEGIQRLGARPRARSPIATLAAMDARVRGHECAPRGRFVGTVEVRAGAGRSSEAERNCVAARRGGEQREANWQSVG